MIINNDNLRFSEIITFSGDLSNEDIILLKRISSTYKWFTLSKVFLMKHYRRSDYIHSSIKKDISLNLMSYNYYDILSARNNFSAIPVVVSSDTDNYSEKITQDDCDNEYDVINTFLSKNITKIDPNVDVEEIDIDSQYDEALLEEVGELMIKQGNYNQALDIYNKLRLTVPEKKDYFSTIIENLKEKCRMFVKK